VVYLSSYLKLINRFLGVLSDLCGEIKEDVSSYEKSYALDAFIPWW